MEFSEDDGTLLYSDYSVVVTQIYTYVKTQNHMPKKKKRSNVC